MQDVSCSAAFPRCPYLITAHACLVCCIDLLVLGCLIYGQAEWSRKTLETSKAALDQCFVSFNRSTLFVCRVRKYCTRGAIASLLFKILNSGFEKLFQTFFLKGLLFFKCF